MSDDEAAPPHGPVDPALPPEQVEAALAAIHRAFGPDGIIGVFLFGSAVASRLRADSDLDLFVVTERPITLDEKHRLLDGLRPISRRSSRPPGWRPLEVTVVTQSDVRPWHYPPHYELQYGEWLSDEDLRTQLECGPVDNPDLAVLIATVRSSGKVLVGQPPGKTLDPVPTRDLARAISDEIPEISAAGWSATSRGLRRPAPMSWCIASTTGSTAPPSWPLRGRERHSNRPEGVDATHRMSRPPQ